MFGKRRKEAEYQLKLAKNEIYQLTKENQDLKVGLSMRDREIGFWVNRPNYIKNLPASPRRVEIEFHIGARKIVMFDGDNFIKPNGQVYRLASIKCWREI